MSTNSSANVSSCYPWEDYVETELDSRVGLAILVICVVTLMADLVFFGLLFSDPKLLHQRSNRFMISICASDAFMVIFLLVFNQPGLSDGRFIAFVNSSPSACLGTILASVFMLAAPWYNFLGLMMDRLYAIKRPMAYSVVVKKDRLLRSILFCWAMAIIPTLPLWFDQTTAEAWQNEEDCKCFYPLTNVTFMWWCCVTMFIIPTSLILLTWVVMAHHFATENENSDMKWVTMKMILLAGLFLLTIFPYSLVFIDASINPPITTTMWLDRTLPISLLNGMLNPVIYIAMISNVREAFLNKFCCKR